MGGTWDSTNVIDSDVAVLTNVDLDHTAVLGTTVGEIASDKVGIFRADAVAIVATTNAIVVEIAQGSADELGATLWLLGDEFVLEDNELALGGRAITLRTPYEPLRGGPRYAARNPPGRQRRDGHRGGRGVPRPGPRRGRRALDPGARAHARAHGDCRAQSR